MRSPAGGDVSGFEFVERLPSVEEYRLLREVVGWGNISDDATEAGLRSSLYSVCLLKEGQVVGCGRIVGDGGLYFYIQDIIVIPQHQKSGLGKRIMERIFSYLDVHAADGVFVGLMAAPGVALFYERLGFYERTSEGPGMYLLWKKRIEKRI